MQNNSPMENLFAAGAVLFLIAAIVLVVLFFYLFYSYCFKKICEKTGKNPGALIWIPLVRYVPLLEVAGLPVWLIVLMLVPFANIVVFVLLWVKICEARKKSPLLVILFLVPIANLVLIPYLAFSE